MAKIPKYRSILSLIRGSHSVATKENVRAPAAAATRGASDSGSVIAGSPAESIQNFWMRDPKTGNWIPENHFGDVDAVELRAKLLSKK